MTYVLLTKTQRQLISDQVLTGLAMPPHSSRGGNISQVSLSSLCYRYRGLTLLPMAASLLYTWNFVYYFGFIKGTWAFKNSLMDDLIQ